MIVNKLKKKIYEGL